MGERFAHVATALGHWMGHPLAFFASLSACVLWLISGPLFGFSDTWQLVINTSTTVVTFLLLFIVQNTQNRNDAALHLKLDELLRASPEARTELALRHLEELSADAIAREQERLQRLVGRLSERANED